jgi:hypothetical protein
VLQTAAAQQRDARELFEHALGKYLTRTFEPIELRAPYACFANAWCELTAKPRDGLRKAHAGLSLEEYREKTRREIEASRPARVCGVRV